MREYSDEGLTGRRDHGVPAAENDLLHLKARTPRAAQAKLLLMNWIAMHDDPEVTEAYEGGRKAFRAERDRLVTLLIEAGVFLPLLAQYLPDL